MRVGVASDGTSVGSSWFRRFSLRIVCVCVRTCACEYACNARGSHVTTRTLCERMHTYYLRRCTPDRRILRHFNVETLPRSIWQRRFCHLLARSWQFTFYDCLNSFFQTISMRKIFRCLFFFFFFYGDWNSSNGKARFFSNEFVQRWNCTELSWTNSTP